MLLASLRAQKTYRLNELIHAERDGSLTAEEHADIASYASLKRCPFIHINTRLHTTKLYGSLAPVRREARTSLKREFAVSKEMVYQGSVLAVNQYRFRMPDDQEVVRDIVERPESVLVLPVGQNGTVLMVEEYDIGAGAWQ